MIKPDINFLKNEAQLFLNNKIINKYIFLYSKRQNNTTTYINKLLILS